MSFTASLPETWENELEAQLNSKLGSAILVEVLPEKVAAFKRAVTDKPIVSVCYHNADYATPKSSAQIVQDSTEVFQIMIRCKFRRGENGIWDLKERIRIALVGFSPSSCGKLGLKKFQFENFEESLWTYSLEFSCPSMVVEDFTDEPGVPISVITATVVTP